MVLLRLLSASSRRKPELRPSLRQDPQKLPVPCACLVVPLPATGEGDNAFWTKISAAWEHEDRKGFNILLTAKPLNGRLVIREPKPVEDQR